MESSNNDISTTETLLPGFGRPLNYYPSEGDQDYVGKAFATALGVPGFEAGGGMLPLLTVREFMMLRFMNSVTDKLDWNIKVNKPEITAKWKEEALASNHEDLTEKMIDYCLDELRYRSTLVSILPIRPPPIVVYNGDVVKSDFALSSQFKEELQEAVKAFEASIPESLKDWHPGSDGKVWDLVHPSLYPLVYGRSKILDNGQRTTLADCISQCGQGQTSEVPTEEESIQKSQYFTDTPYSRKFQWLPCEVDISGDEARITSYINNLHPHREQRLYGLLEKLIDASITLWDLTLAPLRHKEFRHELRIDYTMVEYEKIEGQDPDAEDEYYSDTWDTQPVIRPEPTSPFAPLPSPPKFSLRDAYGKRGLQVIVKLANIELTPEKPEYEGGVWHVEGQMNEHIVATALYYFSNSNITPSSLSFRQWFSYDDTIDIQYEQNKSAWLHPIYGCEQDGPAVQNVGGVETQEGRLLTFPNILQHRVGPFKLADPTKPGHRKIVALFLVDPNIKVISTAHVPCQQQDWWWDNVAEHTSKGIGSLPVEL
ncbi:hypothetical protein BDN70DRAFT_919662, partial [Pholiota conissans]